MCQRVHILVVYAVRVSAAQVKPYVARIDLLTASEARLLEDAVQIRHGLHKATASVTDLREDLRHASRCHGFREQ